MSFTKASFQVFSIFQRYFNTPYLFDKASNCLISNPNYSKKSKKHILFCLAIATKIFLQIAFFVQLCYLFYSFKKKDNNLNLEQIAFSATYFTLALILNSSSFMIVTKHHDLQSVVAEICRLGNGINEISLLKNGTVDLKSLSIYSIVFEVLTIGFAFVLTPFFIDWDPLQALFGPFLVVKIFSAGLYGISIYSGLIFVSIILMLIIIVEYMGIYTSNNFGMGRRHGITNFSSKYKQFRMIQVILIVANVVYNDFMAVLIAVGVLAASIGTYVTLVLWDDLNIFIYMASPALSLCCYMIAILLNQYANKPHANLFNFCILWKRNARNKVEKRIVRSCPHNIGFKCGAYGLLRAKLGIMICDDITQNAVDLILMLQ